MRDTNLSKKCINKIIKILNLELIINTHVRTHIYINKNYQTIFSELKPHIFFNIKSVLAFL
jgi:hypothetical protein